VLFLDRELRVLRMVPAIPPFRTCITKHAVYVLELPAGAIAKTGTETGDQIQMQVRSASADLDSGLKPPAA
jgi:uncharacterized membrane protein (UPF0127 family)